MCCSVLQRVAVRCSMLQQKKRRLGKVSRVRGVAACCSVLQRDAVYCNVLHCVVAKTAQTRSSFSCVLQCVALYCSVLQRVAVCCSVLQCVAVCG